MDLETFENLKDRLNLGNLSKPALIGIVAVLVMVAVAAGRLLIGTATANEFEITNTGSSASATSQAVEEETEPGTIFVHLTGEVVHPGLVEVGSGARVADAVQAAGGFTEDAEAGSVNLARVLTDGEQVVIARHVEPGEIIAEAGQQPQQASSANTSATSSGLVNINTASESELTSLPGIGDATAAKVIADRQSNGSFKTIEDLKRVSGIGDKKFDAIAELICV